MNTRPQVLPALTSRQGVEGEFQPNGETCVVSPPPQIHAYFQNLLKLSLPVSSVSRGHNEICFSLEEALLPALGREGYRLTVTESCANIQSATQIGLLYGGITLVQGLVASPNGTFPCGSAEDIPAYPVRSGMLDVARAYIPLEKLYDLGKYMAWFKLNELHLHINDTGKHGYCAFRLESDVPGLTSADGFYTKADYRNLQKELLTYGVTVVTEIDTPYHSSCFSKVTEDPPRLLDETDPVPWWCRGLCLDIRRAHTVHFVKNLLAEYLTGEDPVFVSPIVHIGMDEYPSSMKDEMTAYVAEITNYVNSLGYTARFWSGLGKNGCMNNPALPSDAKVQLNYWDFALSGPAETVATGFPVVNSINAYLYTVPGNAEAKLGGYTDHYNKEDLKLIYDRWQTNLFSLYAEKKDLLPPCHPNLLGASFSIWNDSHSAHLGLTYRDVLDRVKEAACLTAE
ncbi:MAG: family 20 glycosylhydrolase [Clostridia bacterium]|nr:family 20 glycosylhydrolase [Clostridia bacterium]